MLVCCNPLLHNFDLGQAEEGRTKESKVAVILLEVFLILAFMAFRIGSEAPFLEPSWAFHSFMTATASFASSAAAMD